MELRVAGVGDVADGQMKSVEVAGKKILLAKVDGRIIATEARCPHYGGPLSEGLLNGSRLICPWHKATFSLPEGALLEPPALDPIAAYPVRVDADGVYVDVSEGDFEPGADSLFRADPDADDRFFVVIGGGSAAAAAVETLRRESFAGRIAMVSPEVRVPYDRPNLSKRYMAGDSDASALPLRSREFYEERDIEVVEASVERLDVATRVLQLHDGTTLTPDAILIATGARPRILDVPGRELQGVFTLRTPEDADAIIAAAEQADRVVLVGASFIGMEVASALVKRGLEVTITGPESTPFAGVLGEDVGRMLQEYHEEHGTKFALGSSVVRFLGQGLVSGVEVESGAQIDADVVVVGIGVEPVTEFVVGVERDEDGGLPVDERLRVADGIWAAGDVARYPDAHTGRAVRIEHWRLAQQHGRSAAADMAGSGGPFTGVPFFWTRHFDMSLGHAGVVHPGVEPVVLGDLEARDFTALYAAGGRLLAACGTQPDELAAFLELMRTDTLPPLAELRDRERAGLPQVLREQAS